MPVSLQRTLRTFGFRLTTVFAWSSVSVFFLWAVGAVYYLTFLPRPVAVVLSLAYFTAVALLFFRITNRTKWLSAVAASIVAVYGITLFQRPSTERHWNDAQVRTTSVEVADGQVKIDGFRHCHYQSEREFCVHYQTLEFDVEEIESVWFLVQQFSAFEGLAHTFISFGLRTDEGPKYFSVSVEVRREQGEDYSPIRGLYRQYELLYVIGDERDLIGLRTVIRDQDRVHMYRVNATPTDSQRLFLDIKKRINKLEHQPEFYHTFLNNCTNGIVFHTYDLTAEPIDWLDPRIVLPGFSDRFAYSHGLIGREGQTFAELREEARIDIRAKEIGLSDDFSVRLRSSPDSPTKKQSFPRK